MVDDVVRRLAPLLGIVARERTVGRPDLYDDARQEGLIRAWTVSTEKPDAPREYVLAAAKRGVGDVLRGRPFTGEATRRGWQDAWDHSSSLEVATTSDQQLAIDPADPTVVVAFEGAESRTERTRISRALAELESSDRMHVWLRFWCDMGYPAMAEKLGVPAGTLTRRWTERIRPALRASLTAPDDGYLAGAA